ncbi:hypothetical protein TNCV_546241 [Trichonephila clavipes]|nr:hypothetical protein TNCV_546241 [Trichonephila clavipes]
MGTKRPVVVETDFLLWHSRQCMTYRTTFRYIPASKISCVSCHKFSRKQGVLRWGRHEEDWQPDMSARRCLGMTGGTAFHLDRNSLRGYRRQMPILRFWMAQVNQSFIRKGLESFLLSPKVHIVVGC